MTRRELHAPDARAYYEMPQAAIDRDDIVDFVVPVDDIATLLQKLLMQESVGVEDHTPLG